MHIKTIWFNLIKCNLIKIKYLLLTDVQKNGKIVREREGRENKKKMRATLASLVNKFGYISQNQHQFDTIIPIITLLVY